MRLGKGSSLLHFAYWGEESGLGCTKEWQMNGSQSPPKDRKTSQSNLFFGADST